MVVILIKARSHGACSNIPFSKYALYSAVGMQRIFVARGFVGWLKRSGEMSINARTSKEASRVEMDGDLSTVPMGCCRLCMIRGNGSYGLITTGPIIPNDASESPEN
ncbi:hypothetical protein AVEN_29484-1 [Araneus ventricosus]|uniref:Uncharacterized protein n=1 Tax=Araneus ventricosus TaxID=182803 RepID=A0A4Y2K553_ARAVE|nr:hypothetical protein AVEN_29484-1 [Araneus ventricosus]